MSTLNIAAAQMNISFEQPDENYQNVAGLAAEAAQLNADLFILPEMFATGFSMNRTLVAEPSDGATVSFLTKLARKHQMGVITSYVKLDSDGRAYNMGVVFDRSGRLVHEYAKTHLFSPGGESVQFTAGNRVDTFLFDGVRMALFICYDLRFPEIFRMVAKEAEMAVVVANWPQQRQEHWECLLRARAIENQQFVAGVNCVGQGGGMSFGGGSLFVAADGKVLSRGENREAILMAQMSSGRVAQVRQSFPVLADLRTGSDFEI